VALSFQQFFAVLVDFARNTIAFRPPSGNSSRRAAEIVMAAAKKAPNPIDIHVGSRVRMRRMMLAMSQEKLGDALGLTFQQVRYDRTLEDIFTVQDDVTQSIVAAVE
jgi:hypothetical protein